MTITERAAYVKGLAEGLAIDPEKPESKLINAMMELINDLALTVSDLEEKLDILGEQVDEVDEDLDDLECFVYEDDDDDDYYDDEDEDDDDYFEVECPSCGEVICVDDDILQDGKINCPNCNELLEFEVDGCDCGCDDCKEDK